MKNLPISIIYRNEWGGLIRHRAIYLGNGIVFENSPKHGERYIALDDFKQGKDISLERILTDHPQVLFQRAESSRRQNKPYDVFSNNCDHSTTRVSDGNGSSIQLFGAIAIASIAALLVLPTLISKSRA